MLFVMPISVLLMAGAHEKALAKEFAADYALHGISRYPFWQQHIYFTYVLFLDELKERKYSYEKVARLSEMAELATPPEQVRARYMQNPIITYFMVVIMALVVNFITTSPVWQSEWYTRVIVLSMVVMLLGVVIVGLSLWYPAMSRRRNQHQRIQRYLQWAKYDRKEEQFF